MPPHTDYERLEIEQLAGEYPGLSAYDLHGSLSGLLCSDRSLSCGDWIQAALADEVDALSEAQREVLTRLYAHTRVALASPDLDFQPMLPDDDESLAERIRALAEWCRGFLYGFGQKGGEAEGSEESAEILRDLAEISRLDPDGAPSEQDEEDLMEIIEYVRMAVQALRGEYADHPRYRLH